VFDRNGTRIVFKGFTTFNDVVGLFLLPCGKGESKLDDFMKAVSELKDGDALLIVQSVGDAVCFMSYVDTADFVGIPSSLNFNVCVLRKGEN
jgi:hypothetical protein